MAAARDAVIIGAGHNGLVTAFYLARAGLKPLVLERRPVVGGAAITEEFHSGFKCSALAHTTGPLLPAVVEDMQLGKHGLCMIAPMVRVFAPALDGRALVLHSDLAESARQIANFSKRDAQKFLEFAAALAKAARLIRRLLTMTPPDIDRPSSGDLWNLLRAGKAFRNLGKKDMQRLLRWGPMAVADFTAEFFRMELLRAIVAARGIFGCAMGPWSAGTTARLLLGAGFDSHPAGLASFPRGGMGALSEAMASAARRAGAEVRTSAEVQTILAKNGAVTGVVLSAGEEIAARAVISGVDPKRTFLRFFDPAHFTPSFLVKIQRYRMPGTVAKLHLALDGLPSFTALAKQSSAVADLSHGADAALTGRIHIGPDIDYLERAFDHSKYGEFSREPYLDAMIPSLSDPSLAPPGKHVMSIHVQFAPYKLKTGDWTSCRDALADTIIKTLAVYAPDLPGRILARHLITPKDLEDCYGLTQGHPFHGELALDQLFTMRPLLGWARYRAPLRGLYLCGSGTHPGAGLSGACAFNAAREILKDFRR